MVHLGYGQMGSVPIACYGPWYRSSETTAATGPPHVRPRGRSGREPLVASRSERAILADVEAALGGGPPGSRAAAAGRSQDELF